MAEEEQVGAIKKHKEQRWSMSQHERPPREYRRSILRQQKVSLVVDLEGYYILLFQLHWFLSFIQSRHPVLKQEEAKICPKTLTIKPTSTWPPEAYFGMATYLITRTVDTLFNRWSLQALAPSAFQARQHPQLNIDTPALS